MPTYGYRCTSCGHEFERFQKMTDPPIKECETCQAPVKKILYPVGISFKGDGFYVNDYAPKSAKNADKPAESSETKPADTAAAPGTSETKSDTPAVAPAAPASSSPSATPATSAPAAKPALS